MASRRWPPRDLISINTQAIQELKQEKDAEIKVRDEKIAALEARLADWKKHQRRRASAARDKEITASRSNRR